MAREKKVSAKIKEFWNARAGQDQVSADQVTHKDIWQRWLEITMMAGYIRKADRVLDVGCGNGYSTRIFAKSCREIVGIDYSEDMVRRALQESRKQRSRPAPKFEQCDVLDLNPARFGQFDLAISERCLINLETFEKQKRAIANIASMLRRGGRYIFVEGTADGRERLNRYRRSVGLPAMPKVWHNIDFKEAETLRFLKRFFIVEERLHFGMYDFLSRVVHPLMVMPDEPRYDARINEVAAKLALDRQEFGDLSRVLFLVLKKK